MVGHHHLGGMKCGLRRVFFSLLLGVTGMSGHRRGKCTPQERRESGRVWRRPAGVVGQEKQLPLTIVLTENQVHILTRMGVKG